MVLKALPLAGQRHNVDHSTDTGGLAWTRRVVVAETDECEHAVRRSKCHSQLL
jgi:hypothetical protein